MLIDIHTHASMRVGFSRPNGSRFPTVDEFIEMLDYEGIDKAVMLCSMSPECTNQYIPPDEVMEMTEKYPDRLIPFCNLDPRMQKNSPDADFMPMLTHFKDLGFKGVGEYIPNIPFDDPLNMNVFRQVAEVGLPLTFHIAPAIGGYYGVYDELGLPRLERVLKEFPGLILLAHSQPFWAEISADLTPDLRMGYPEGKVTPGRVVELMRKYPNLHGDLSAGSGFNAISRDPEFGYAFMEEFQDRLYFGTDICNIPQENPIVPYFRELKEKKLIPEEVHEKITWRNAVRLVG